MLHNPSRRDSGYMVRRLHEMLHDARPVLSASQEGVHSDDDGLIAQLDAMYSEQAITSRPSAFYQLEGSDPHRFAINPEQSQPHHVRNRYHPMSSRLVEQIAKLRAALGSDVYVCGGNSKQRFALTQSKSTLAMPKAVAIIVPAYGDIVCAYEMMSLIDSRLQGRDAHPERPIIIDNSGDYWKYLLWHFDDKALSQAGIFRLREYEWDKAKPLIKSAKSRAVFAPDEDVTIPPDSLILVGTKTNEKIIELQELFKGSGVRVMRLDHFANFQDPPENSGTFAGNAMEKIRNSHHALRQRAAEDGERLRRNLLRHCPNPQQPHIFILSEDSGIHLEDPRISRHMQQEGTLQGKVKDALVLHHDQFPGVEFGPVLNGALGEQGFWDAVNDVIERHKNDERSASRTRNRGVVNSSVIALSPYDMNAPKTIQPVYMFSGTNMSMLLDSPIHAADEIPNTSHYLVPVTQPFSGELPSASHLMISTERKTQAQLGAAYLGQHSARSFAANALRAQMALGANAAADITGTQLHLGISNPASAAAFSRAFISQQSPLRAIDFSGDQWPNQAEALCAQPDMYYLSPRTANSSNHPALLEDLFRFCSLIVSKQLVPRDKDKPIIVHGDDASWQPFLQLYDHLRHIGMANDQQNTFIQRVDSPQHISALLEQTARNHFCGEHYTPNQFMDVGMQALQAQPAAHFNVAMFCSASSKNQTFNDEARLLGAHLAQSGHGMVFGAADKEMMGSARLGFLNAPKPANAGLLIGSSTQDILPIESQDPHKVVDSLDVYHHAATIYDRMQFMMQQSDAFAIYPGGVGTVQELALLLAAKAAKNPDMQGKPILLYNRPLKDFGLNKGFYDPLIEMIGRDKLQQLGVQICSSPSEVFAAIDHARLPLATVRAAKV